MDRLEMPIQVLRQEIPQHKAAPAAHHYYELVYVFSGSGIHYNNGLQIAFQSGDVFWVKAGDKHWYETHTASVFFLVRFNEDARLVLKQMTKNSNGNMPVLAKTRSPLNLKISLTKTDQTLTTELLGLMMLLCENTLLNETILYHQFLCFAGIIERNTAFSAVTKPKPFAEKNITSIIRYIHRNVHKPEMLRIRAIASRFGMSNNTVMTFFKNEMQQSVKQYIEDCKMKLIEKELRNSENSLSEIAFKFGYTDESHFSKRFKKHFGLPPKDFRKN